MCHLCFAGNYVLNYLASRPKLLNYVTQALVQVECAVAFMLFLDDKMNFICEINIAV